MPDRIFLKLPVDAIEDWTEQDYIAVGEMVIARLGSPGNPHSATAIRSTGSAEPQLGLRSVPSSGGDEGVLSMTTFGAAQCALDTPMGNDATQ